MRYFLAVGCSIALHLLLCRVWDAAAATHNIPFTMAGTTGRSVTVLATDSDIDASFELVAKDGSYAQLAAADSLVFLLSAATDSVRVRAVLIRLDSTRVDTLIRLKGANADTTDRKYLFVESAAVDSGLAMTGTMTVTQWSDGAHVTQIAIGDRTDYGPAQYFVTKKERRVYVAHWKAGVTTTTGTVEFELRWYRDWASAYSPDAKYEVVDTIVLPAALGGEVGAIKRPLLLGNWGTRRGWISVWAKGGSVDSDGYAIIQIDSYR